MLGTLQKHTKTKIKGKDIFCPFCQLNSLTERLSNLICNNTFLKENLD